MLVIAGSLCARYVIFESTNNPYLTIVTLVSCLDMLTTGALAAVVKGKKALVLAGALGFVIVSYGFYRMGYQGFAETSLWVPHANYMFTGLGLLFCPLMRFANHISLLRAKPMLYIGKISYGLYIWHLLAFAIAHKLPINIIAQGVFGMIISFVIAAASWHFFESRILRYKDVVVLRPSRA